ncbi:Predicted arabinose efflux permease, MFS family [Friedmanniella luteola]|uniref:Predicted arabinose efflux permease, MFS family n=1 Tax=Friedmanniella luteola TaxID=546871 RepID=A0A1H1SVL1_9ACTN|nr:Predicted arabinose efflux permease, MFS family [Friedmanniella luteola]
MLGDRDVALVWCSNLISATGTGAMFVAVPFCTYLATGSVLATALVALAEYAPTVGVAQLAGVLVDRWDPRGVLVIADVALAACTLAYLLHDAWWWFAMVGFCRSCVAQFVLPASQTLIAGIAPEGRLAEVNGLNAVGSNIARLAGPAVGGVLLSAGGLQNVALADAASFLLAAWLIATVRSSRTASLSAGGGLVHSWREGWSAVRDHPVLRPLVLVMALVGFGEGFISALMAPWMTDVAGGGSTELGLMLSLQALGGMLGGLIVVRCAPRWDSMHMLGTGALASGALLIIIFNYPLLLPVGPWPAIALTALAGLPFAVYGTAQAIAVQQHSAEGLRGRTASLTFGTQGIAQLTGIGLAGPIAGMLGPLAINAETIAYLVAGTVALTAMRRQRRSTTTTPGQPQPEAA